MKTMKYLLVALATGSLMAACNTDIESLTIQRPLTYDDQYYQNLRDYKASDHEIALDGLRSMELKTQRLFDLWDCPTVSIFVLCGVVFLQRKILRYGTKFVLCRK